MSTQQTALDAYLACTATIHAKLARLQQLADDHFGHDPDAINWGHVVGVLNSDQPLDKQRKETGLAWKTPVLSASAKASRAAVLAGTPRGVVISGKKPRDIRALQFMVECRKTLRSSDLHATFGRALAGYFLATATSSTRAPLASDVMPTAARLG